MIGAERRTGEDLVRFLHECGLDIELRIKRTSGQELFVNAPAYFHQIPGTHVHLRVGQVHVSRFIDDAYLKARDNVVDWTIDRLVQNLIFDKPISGGHGCDCF